MKNFIYFALIPVLAIIITQQIKPEPDIVYSLSKSIVIANNQGNSPENIQQLEIKNIGEEVARNIIVKVLGAINSVDILKFSSKDVVTQDLTHEILEVKYENLMPTGSFSIVVRTNQTISNDDVSIVCENGKAVDAFSKDIKLSAIIIAASVILLLLYIAIIAYLGYKDFLMQEARSDSAITLIKKIKPWIITEAYWKKILFTANSTILNNFFETYYSSIDTSPPYLFLNSEVDLILDQESRQKLINIASKALSNIVKHQIYFAYRINALEAMLSLKMPRHMPQDDWIYLLGLIQANYIHLKTKELLGDLFSKKLYLKEDFKLDSLRPELQASFLNFMKEYNFFKSLLIISSSSNVSEDYKSTCKYTNSTERRALYDTAKSMLYQTLARQHTIDELRSIINSNSDWLAGHDQSIILNIINKVDNTLKFRDALIQAIDRNTLSDDLSKNLNESQVDLIKNIVSILCKENDLHDKKLELLEELDKTKITKNKVLKQLQFIDELLKNPEAIDRIEDYEDTFSRINYKNLKLISNVLTEMKNKH